MQAFYLVVALGWGYLGYRAAARYAHRHGRTPWDIPPVVWGVIWGASLILGGVLMGIATRHDREVIPVRIGWLARMAMMIVGFGLGPLLLIAGGETMARADGETVTGMAATVIGVALTSVGIHAVRQHRRTRVVEGG